MNLEAVKNCCVEQGPGGMHKDPARQTEILVLKQNEVVEQ